MLLLPLLGGYIFVRFWYHTKIHILRSDKERLLIRASIVGLFALIIAYLVHLFFVWIFPCETDSICVSRLWREKIPFEYLDVSLIAFAIGALGWIPINYLFYDKDDEIDRAIKEDADPLELLLKRAQDGTIAVLLTMTNHKVYIGFITHQFNPVTPTSHIGLYPLQSGYREETTKEMHLTINCSRTHKKIGVEIENISAKISELEKMSLDEQMALCEAGHPDYMQLVEMWEKLVETTGLFELVIPTNQIASISFYDDQLHKKYFQPSPK